MRHPLTIALMVLCAGLIVALMLQECTREPEVEVRTFRVPVTVQPKDIAIKSQPLPPRIMWMHDTTQIATPDSMSAVLLQMIDTLQAQLASRQIRRAFVLDSVIGGDTVYILCDETNRRVEANIRHAPITTEVVVHDTIPIGASRMIVRVIPFVALSAHVPLASSWVYQGNAGVRLQLTRAIIPFADVQIMTTSPPQLRLGIELQY